MFVYGGIEPLPASLIIDDARYLEGSSCAGSWSGEGRGGGNFFFSGSFFLMGGPPPREGLFWGRGGFPPPTPFSRFGGGVDLCASRISFMPRNRGSEDDPWNSWGDAGRPHPGHFREIGPGDPGGVLVDAALLGATATLAQKPFEWWSSRETCGRSSPDASPAQRPWVAPAGPPPYTPKIPSALHPAGRRRQFVEGPPSDLRHGPPPPGGLPAPPALPPLPTQDWEWRIPWSPCPRTPCRRSATSRGASGSFYQEATLMIQHRAGAPLPGRLPGGPGQDSAPLGGGGEPSRGGPRRLLREFRP